jgi:hypothetical protein
VIDVMLEGAVKRVFAVAIDWPGWARAGPTERDALDALIGYAMRYAAVLEGTPLAFETPSSRGDLTVVERVDGTATTDFGAPDVPSARDRDPVDEAELERLITALRATWRALDRAVGAADGVPLATGPRGGGRSLEKIVDHVLDADTSYVGRLGMKVPEGDDASRIERVRATAVAAIENGVREGVREGPRGGKRWTPRYFVRRSAWHVLDHAWEIEDRWTR